MRRGGYDNDNDNEKEEEGGYNNDEDGGYRPTTARKANQKRRPPSNDTHRPLDDTYSPSTACTAQRQYVRPSINDEDDGNDKVTTTTSTTTTSVNPLRRGWLVLKGEDIEEEDTTHNGAEPWLCSKFFFFCFFGTTCT